MPYDALDPELLLWVHACLVDTAMLMERLVVGALDDAGRQQLYEESMVQAEMLRIPRRAMPATVGGLHGYMDEVLSSGVLRPSDGSEAVANLIREPPPDTPQRPLWKLISLWSFGLLPAELKELYEVRDGPARAVALRASLFAVRHLRRFAPPEWRLIPPARLAAARLSGGRSEATPADTIMPGRLKVPGAG